MIPQKVVLSKFDKAGYMHDQKEVDRPTLGLVFVDNGFTCDVIVDNEMWSVRSDLISKGENYVGKTYRGL